MAVWYLDNDDEITDAVARLRGTSDEYVVYVVPPGSRIATGRINFKLLAREAATRDVRMAVASADEQVRALAISAGVLSATTADAALAALERGDEAPLPSESTVETDGVAAEAVMPAVESGLFQGWSGQRLAATTAVVLLLAMVGLFVAYQTLPTAEITLVPRAVAVGPLDVSVQALPDLDEPDVDAGHIPAVVLPIPLSIERTFPASGVETVAVPATGEVVFTSAETFQDIAIGTRVMTPSEIEFQTTERVTLPAPEAGKSESSVIAPVIAVEAGVEGNVPAEKITVVPSLEDQGISVSNPEAMSGGRLDETPTITAADYDAAEADIQNRLAGLLTAHLRDPASAPEGLMLFPETALPGEVSLTPGSDALVGAGEAQFTLGGSLAATVLAVDESLVGDLARERLATAVSGSMALIPDRVTVEVGQGRADGQEVRYSSVAQGEAAPPVDMDDLRAQVAGLPISEARAILEAFGPATVTVWPGFLTDLPGDPSRITLDVREPSTTE